MFISFCVTSYLSLFISASSLSTQQSIITAWKGVSLVLETLSQGASGSRLGPLSLWGVNRVWNMSAAPTPDIKAMERVPNGTLYHSFTLHEHQCMCASGFPLVYNLKTAHQFSHCSQICGVIMSNARVFDDTDSGNTLRHTTDTITSSYRLSPTVMKGLHSNSCPTVKSKKYQYLFLCLE